MVWNVILYRMVLLQQEKWKEHMWRSRRKVGEDSMHEGTYFTPNIVYILIIFAQLCSKCVECIYGVIYIFVSVHMHVFVWSSKSHFGLQGM